MASPGNQHCANCIDTLSFPIGGGGVIIKIETVHALPMALRDHLLEISSRDATNQRYMVTVSPVITHLDHKNCLMWEITSRLRSVIYLTVSRLEGGSVAE